MDRFYKTLEIGDLDMDIQHALLLVGMWLANSFYTKFLRTKQYRENPHDQSSNHEIYRRHPLLIPPVMENVLRLLDTKDLKTCRLVCNTWNIFSTAILKNKTTVYLSEEVLNAFLDKNTNLLDFQNFHIKFELNHHVLTLFQEFLTSFGSQIHNFHVEMNDPGPDSTDISFSNYLDDFLEENMNNWRTLSLDFKSYHYKGSPSLDNQNFKINWYTKLRNLRISEDWEDMDFIVAIFTRDPSLDTLYATCTKLAGMSYRVLNKVLKNFLSEEEDAREREVIPTTPSSPGINLFGWDNEPDFAHVPISVEFRADLQTLVPDIILRTNLSLLVITTSFLNGDVIFICTAFPKLNRIKIYLAKLDEENLRMIPSRNSDN